MAAIDVLLVHWNRPQECARTIDAFRAQRDVTVSVSVIDNASSPSARERLAQLQPHTEVEVLSRNVGYGAAMNIGISRWLKRGEGHWLVMAPHDALPAPDCLNLLVDALRDHPRRGLVSAEYGTDVLPGYRPVHGYGCYAATRGAGFRSTEFAHGTLLLASRSCLDAVGGFDERYFAYGEEYDLALRAKRAGFDVGIVWGALVQNPIREAGSKECFYLNVRNGLLATRARSGLSAAVLRSAIVVGNGLRTTVRPSLRAEGDALSLRLRAVSDFWTGRFGAPPWQREQQ